MMFMYNQKLVADANATGTIYDVAFMGDSVIAYTVVVPAVAAVWDRFWGPSSGLKAARLGVGCSTVEELVWRIMSNGEKFAQDPKVVVLLVGINNSLESKPWKALEFLVKWMRVAMPRTKVLILAPLPNFLGTSDTFRVQYRRVAQRCPQCTFSTCGSTLNWRSHKLYMDPAHPNARGYTIVWNCLKPAVLKLLKTT
ncbi:hypothetical protein COHA_000274 [Chlorella ohadii]|uniref:SGNH hydrolase-type esterase domain-containing protein n=1 Tax=Chlorella ohadii TaxID=2649997 RepID=A0AAD5E1C0_9CHLO|nr:hypothetical protein COHA_000274 [Chlorella ohadii]